MFYFSFLDKLSLWFHWDIILWDPDHRQARICMLSHPHTTYEAIRLCCRALTGYNLSACSCCRFVSLVLTQVYIVRHTSVECAGTCRAGVRWWRASAPVCSWCGLTRWSHQRGRTCRWGWMLGHGGVLWTYMQLLVDTHTKYFYFAN